MAIVSCEELYNTPQALFRARDGYLSLNSVPRRRAHPSETEEETQALQTPGALTTAAEQSPKPGWTSCL